ncbi:MAG: PHP domain-containing protein [Victivallaceae bacterium]|nr:PHP domain-containing protein [Victivallaceae bacterium]
MLQAIKRIDDFRVSPEERLDAVEFLKHNFNPDLSTVCEVDLHCHSFYSDGYCSPAMRVFEAWRRGMKAIAISDHDLFDGQLEAIEAAEIFGIEVIPAIEFYTDRAGIEIIGHFPDINEFKALLESREPNKIIEPLRTAKQQQLKAMLERIPDCFATLEFDAEITELDIDHYLRNGISTKGDISVAMWQKYGNQLKKRQLAEDVKIFHTLYTTQDDKLNIPLEIDLDISPQAFVKRIRDWGGLPGLPHPGELRKKEGLNNMALRKTIEFLAACGLQTIEVDGWRNGICPETGIPQTELFNQLRLEYNASHPNHLPLLFTNGSDDHNQPGEGLELGCGRNGNLHPEFGSYENIIKLRKRQHNMA